MSIFPAVMNHNIVYQTICLQISALALFNKRIRLALTFTQKKSVKCIQKHSLRSPQNLRQNPQHIMFFMSGKWNKSM